MSTEAKAIIDPLLQFKFRFEVNGYPAAYVQDFDPPASEIGVVELAGAGMNHTVKFPGFRKYNEMTLKTVITADGPAGVFFHKWMDDCQDPDSGDGKSSVVVKKNCSMYEIGVEGNPVRVWEIRKGWPSKLKTDKKDGKNDKDPVYDEVTLQCDDFRVRAL